MQLAPPHISRLASDNSATENPDILMASLRLTTNEGKYLEWKSTPPIDKSSLKEERYRFVKAAISFANTEGGFIVFGINSQGEWIGFDKKDLICSDPADVSDLINGCIQPEICNIYAITINFEARLYYILHIPPSPIMPHITIKEVSQQFTDGKSKIYLAKNTVYSRHLAQSVSATPSDFNRIVNYRVELLRSEILRKVKEVNIPIIKTSSVHSPVNASTIIVKPTDDPSAPHVHITKDQDTNGFLVREILTDTIFEDVNNILQANTKIGASNGAFAFNKSVYYRIYLDRESVSSDQYFEQLTRFAIKHYCPYLFWVLKLPDYSLINLIRDIATKGQDNEMRILIRFLYVCGEYAYEWLGCQLEERWHGISQPPQHFHTYRKILNKKNKKNRLFDILDIDERKSIELPDHSKITIAMLINNLPLANTTLNSLCKALLDEKKDFRSSCTLVDYIRYGLDVAKRGELIGQKLLAFDEHK